MLPLLEDAAKSKGAATIVMVSSTGHFDTYAEGFKPTVADMVDEKQFRGKKAYGQSKLANILFAQELAERYKGKNILANSIHPGLVATQLMKEGFGGWFEPYVGAELAEKIKDTLVDFAWSPEVAALTQIYTAVSKEVKAKKITGKYFHPIARETGKPQYITRHTLKWIGMQS